MKPKFRILRGGVDVTANLNDRLLELDYTEHEGKETDTISFHFDDRDFAIELPARGDKILFALGYEETGLVDKGEFEVTDVGGRGPPFAVIVKAKSASHRDDQKSQRTDNHENKSVKDVVETIAKRHKLKAKVGDGFDADKFAILNQTEESDWHVLARLARDYDAAFSVKNGNLVFVKSAQGESASGKQMQQITLRKTDLIAYTFGAKDRPRHKKVVGHWYDKTKGKRVKQEAKKGAVDSDGATFYLRHLYPDGTKAQAAAEAKLRELGRAEGNVTVEIEGDAEIVAVGSVVIQTGRTGLDGEWTVKTVTHSISSEGFRTKISADSKSGVSDSKKSK